LRFDCFLPAFAPRRFVLIGIYSHYRRPVACMDSTVQANTMHSDDYTVAFPFVALQRRQRGGGLGRSRVTSFSGDSNGMKRGGCCKLTSNMISTGQRVPAKTILAGCLSIFVLLELEDLYFPAMMSLSHRNNADWMTLASRGRIKERARVYVAGNRRWDVRLKE
jgi:hypothetical protein